MSLTLMEERILDLYDDGLSPRQIQSKGFSASQVRFVLGSYGGRSGDLAESKRNTLAMQQGSRSFLAAIDQARSA